MIKSKAEHAKSVKYAYFECYRCKIKTAVPVSNLKYFYGNRCECGGELIPCKNEAVMG